MAKDNCDKQFARNMVLLRSKYRACRKSLKLKTAGNVETGIVPEVHPSAVKQ